MVYQIHLRCDANVTDDSGGNVYAMAMTEDYLNNSNRRKAVTAFMLGNLDEPFVVNIGQIIADKNTVTPVSNILTQYVTSIADNVVKDLNLHDYYTVYVLAVDGKGNPSEVYPEENLNDRKLRGNIAARSAPVETDSNVSYDPLGGVTYTANLDSDVYFEYIIATFTSNVGEDAATAFFDGILKDLNTVDSRLYVYANVNSDYDGFNSETWDRAKKSIESVVMGNVIANIANDTEYYPYVDKTKPLHTYLYAVNHNPHNTSLMSVNDITQADPSNIQLANVDIFLKDYSFELSFDITNKTTSTTAYVGVFDTPKTNIDVSGDQKRDLIEHYVHLFDSANLSAASGNVEITQFYGGSSRADIVNKQTYHVYVMLFDTNTGETSAIFRQENITIGNFPLLARNDGAFLNNLLVTRENTSVSSNADQYVREQSNLSAYFGLFDANVENEDAVNFMVNNHGSASGTVFANIDVPAPTAENELWPIPTMDFQSYQWNLDDPAAGFKAINVTSDTKLVTYIVDDTPANVTYVTDIPALSPPIVVPVSIRIERKLDDGFELVCANAEANIVNYVMAFDEFVPLDKFDAGGVFVDNLKTNALQIESNVMFLLTQVHDRDAITSSNIVNGNVYHIYSYALQRQEGVYGIANVDDVAKHVPLISYVYVNFDQFA
jgi:hypothetical protein